MASYKQGYDEERFATTVSQNFICLICLNVLRDPVLCQRNQHCFCRACITRHLENSQRCPTCADKLTVETFAEPNRMVKDYLNELNIRCEYASRGCQEIVQLQQLDRHEDSCQFMPVVCTNQGCRETVNKCDLVHHATQLCEFSKLKYNSKSTKKMSPMEKRIAKMETNMMNMERNLERSMTQNMKQNTAELKRDLEQKLAAVNNEVGGLKAALIQGFDEMKEALVKTETASGGKNKVHLKKTIFSQRAANEGRGHTAR